MRPMKREWNSYCTRVVSPDASPARVRELRLAFYGGAGYLWQLLPALLTRTGDADRPTAEDREVIVSIHKEVIEIGESMIETMGTRPRAGRFKAGWVSFRALTLIRIAAAGHVAICRNAYYSGVVVLWTLVNRVAQKQAPEADLDSIDEEMKEFAEQIESQFGARRN